MDTGTTIINYVSDEDTDIRKQHSYLVDYTSLVLSSIDVNDKIYCVMNNKKGFHILGVQIPGHYMPACNESV